MKLGRYEVIGTLGAGGMSSASLARAPSGDLVVLKRQLVDTEDAALLDEARVGLRLHHPHIVDHLDLFMHEGRPVLVVEYVRGATLADLRLVGPLPSGLVIRIGYEIASALNAIHTATEDDGTPLNCLHRDVTPSNIILGMDGHARLIDFGIARSAVTQHQKTDKGHLRGTLRYLAPELFDTGDYSVRTDLWGLGMSLWEAAFGRLAIEGSGPVVYARIVSKKPLALLPGETLDPRLGSCVAQLLSPEPECRPPDSLTAASVFGAFLGQFEDLDRIARAYVEESLGPKAETIDASTSIVEAQELLDMAAAAYNGPRALGQLVDGATPETGGAGADGKPVPVGNKTTEKNPRIKPDDKLSALDKIKSVGPPGAQTNTSKKAGTSTHHSQEPVRPTDTIDQDGEDSSIPDPIELGPYAVSEEVSVEDHPLIGSDEDPEKTETLAYEDLKSQAKRQKNN